MAVKRGARRSTEARKYDIDLLPNVKLETIVRDNRADETLAANVEAAGTGNIGDGKVFVSDISKVVRIRNSEMNDEAI